MPTKEQSVSAPVESKSACYVATYTFWDDVTILCCGFDEALVEKKGHEIAEKRNLRNFKANIDVIEVEEASRPESLEGKCRANKKINKEKNADFLGTVNSLVSLWDGRIQKLVNDRTFQHQKIKARINAELKAIRRCKADLKKQANSSDIEN